MEQAARAETVTGARPGERPGAGPWRPFLAQGALPDLAPRIQELGAKYSVAMGPAMTIFTDAGPIRIAAAEPPGVPVQAEASKADAASMRSHANKPGLLVKRPSTIARGASSPRRSRNER